jgi:hypothetical protein
MSNVYRRLDEPTRRDLLALGAKALFGVTISSLLPSRLFAGDPSIATTGLQAPRPMARNVIYLYMSGGMSHLDTFDPKSVAEVAGPVKAIPTSADGIQISEYLPKTAQVMHRFALIRSVTSTQGAHEQGNYYVHTSYRLLGTIRHPAMGAWLGQLSGRTNDTLPASVLIGGDSQHPGSGFMESKYAPLPIGDPASGLKYSTKPNGVDDERFSRRLQLLDHVNQPFRDGNDLKQVRAYRDLYDEAVKLMNSRDLKAFDMSEETQAMRDAYGEDRFGQGCLLARRLIEHDVRFVEVTLGGWDTHDDNFDRVQTRCEVLDTALSTLMVDLEARGLLDETMVVLASEFGRTPKINSNTGRDHHPRCFTTLLAGGGIRGGQVYGESDERGEMVGNNHVSVPDFNATIAYGLGLPLDKVLSAPNGRPFTIADKGRPLTNLF